MTQKLRTLIQSIHDDLNKERHGMNRSEGLGRESHRWNIARLEARLQGIEEASKLLLDNSGPHNILT